MAAPRGLRYLPAGVADCKVLVTQADGAALGAERSGEGLRVELARLAAPAGLLLGQKGRVVGCRHLGEAKVARQVVTLSRVGPDEAVAASAAPERPRAPRRGSGEVRRDAGAARRSPDEAIGEAGEFGAARLPTVEERSPAAAVQGTDEAAE